jgi:hypothetical protein
MPLPATGLQIAVAADRVNDHPILAGEAAVDAGAFVVQSGAAQRLTIVKLKLRGADVPAASIAMSTAR